MKTSVRIKGMSCNHCVQAVSRSLQDLPGLKKVEIDLSDGIVSLDHDDNLDIKVVEDRIVKAGYEIA